MKKSTGEQIDLLLPKHQNHEIRDMGYSMPTIKYRRAKMYYPRSYKRLLKRARKYVDKSLA